MHSWSCSFFTVEGASDEIDGLEVIGAATQQGRGFFRVAGTHLPYAGPGVGVVDQRDVADVFLEAVEVETQYAEQRIVGIDPAQLPLPVSNADQRELSANVKKRRHISVPAQRLGVMQ